MNRALLIRIAICIFSFGFFLYSYIDKQNNLTKLRINIPTLVKEVGSIHEECTRMQYEIDQFENPGHLIELARHSEFSHLKHPFIKDILTVDEGIAIQGVVEKQEEIVQVKPKLTLAVGTKD
jgi:hypothetical protein